MLALIKTGAAAEAAGAAASAAVRRSPYRVSVAASVAVLAVERHLLFAGRLRTGNHLLQNVAVLYARASRFVRLLLLRLRAAVEVESGGRNGQRRRRLLHLLLLQPRIKRAAR